MALVVWEMALALAAEGAAEVAPGAWAQAPMRAGPKEIARTAAGLRSILRIFTVHSYSLISVLGRAPKKRSPLALRAVLVALLDHRLATDQRGRGARSYAPCANNYL